MEREVARELLVPFVEGELDEQTAGLLQRHLADDPVLRRELEQLRKLDAAIEACPPIEPDGGMRADFERLLAEEKRRAQGRGRTVPHSIRFTDFAWWISASAAALFAFVGAGLGWFVARQGGVGHHGQGGTMAEVESLRRDVSVLRGMLFDAALSSRSASFRLQTMSLAADLDSPDADVVDVLFSVLLGDPSANVRLAALEALARFKDDAAIRSRLAAALTEQSDPIVQIALIGVLVDSGASEAREPFERLLLDPDAQPVVKGAAQSGLTRL
jgi:hypothetical protein